MKKLDLLQQVVGVHLFLQLMVLCNRHSRVLLSFVVLSLVFLIHLIHILVRLILQRLALDLLSQNVYQQGLQNLHKHQQHNLKGQQSLLLPSKEPSHAEENYLKRQQGGASTQRGIMDQSWKQPNPPRASNGRGGTA